MTEEKAIELLNRLKRRKRMSIRNGEEPVKHNRKK